MKRSILLLLIALLLCVIGGRRALGGEVTIPIGERLDLDTTGQTLRRAVTAWEAAEQDPLPRSWSRFSLREGETLQLAPELFLYAPPSAPGAARILVIDSEGPHEVVILAGREAIAGPLRLILINASTSGRTMELLARATEEAPLLLDPTPTRTSTTTIQGRVNPARIVVSTPDPRLLDFAQRFLGELRSDRSPEEAARSAREAVPPAAFDRTPPPSRSAYTDRHNILDEADDQPFSAGVTLRLVRCDAESFQQLTSTMSYRSDGDTPDEPRVRVQGGGRGGQVDIGSPGDRFEATLRALERSRRVSVESETFVNVPLGGESLFELAGPRDRMSAIVGARRQGRFVLLRIDNQAGDWGFSASNAATVRVRDGGTATIARWSSSRTESSSSGLPIAQDIPYLGPVFRNERKSSSSSNFALFVSVMLQ